MKKGQPKTISVSRQPGQISAPGGELSNYLIRNMPIWGNPQWLSSNQWREFVRKQPIATLCRDTLASHLLSLDWSIVARDSEQQDELKGDIKYYTKLFERGNAYYSSLDFTEHIEWIVKDLLDLPFGTASEIGREYDSPDGKVVWIRPLDGGTLTPTLNADYPVAQHYHQYSPVVFPRDSISRIYLSPRTEIQREGWGMAPPERIYLAMEMLNRGDSYYSQLLLNTPEAGILDLGDMEMTAATEWVKSFRDLLFGINPLKIPVLYEHTSDAKWIPFGKLPSEIMYEGITNRYITIVTAGYGITPSDIGFASSSNGGETLSGTIRQERRSARSGKAIVKKKVQAYFDKILPDELTFRWIDYDDEKQVSTSRARMANANAFSMFIDKQVFEPDEARRQLLADGMITISVPEKLNRKSVDWPVAQPALVPGNRGSNELGSPKVPSSGGQGDTIPQQILQKNRAKIEVSVSKAVFAGNQILGGLINSVNNGKNDLGQFEKKFDNAVTGKAMADLVTEAVIDDTYNCILDIISKSDWPDTVSLEFAKHNQPYLYENSLHQRKLALIKQAENEFIDGIRDSIDLNDEETLELEHHYYSLSVPSIKKSILEKLIPMIILVSKSEILGYKYPIDTTKVTDSNSLKLARTISNKVFGMMPSILDEIMKEKLGEKV